MQKKTIKDAVIAVLQENQGGLQPRDIYNKILERDYYKFGAKNPLSVVTSVIRQHCSNIQLSRSNSEKYFKLNEDGSYSLA